MFKISFIDNISFFHVNISLFFIIYHFLHVHEEIKYNILIKLLAFGMWIHKYEIAYNLTGGIYMFNVWILCF